MCLIMSSRNLQYNNYLFERKIDKACLVFISISTILSNLINLLNYLMYLKEDSISMF